jgi:predicted NUDIX family NTP pyrophosphohydrolase
MAGETSAGLLMYTRTNDILKVFLVHPGGPFFRNKDEGFWSIPKGLIEKNEEYLQTAIREFKEETGITPADGEYLPLGSIKQKNGKVVYAWALAVENDGLRFIGSNTFKLEWPPRSGNTQEFPEIDKAEFFTVETAKTKINEAQIELISRLEKHLNSKEI